MKHRHLRYAQQVVEGVVPANKFCIAQCSRVLSEHTAGVVEDGEDKFVFDARFAEHVEKFVRQIPHIQGSKVGTNFELEPWQRFFVHEVYGWRNKADKQLARYNYALLEVGRKNGKTFLGSSLCLHELVTGDYGAEIYAAATTQKQARIAWDRAVKMLRQSPYKRGSKIYMSRVQIEYDQNRLFAPVSRESQKLDGTSPTFVLIDEAAAITDPVIFEVLRTGMGSARSPLTLCISTAQYKSDTYYSQIRTKHVEDVTEGFSVGRNFAMLYGLDEGDDFRVESNWVKANPNLDVSLTRKWLAGEVENADRFPADRPGILVKNFCHWTGATGSWIDAQAWNDCTADKLYMDAKCYLGIDLAIRRDLCAVGMLWSRADGVIEVDTHAWVPHDTFDTLPEKERQLYMDAEASGKLKIVDGAVVPTEEIYAYVLRLHSEYDVQMVGADPFNATQLTDSLENAGVNILDVGQSIGKLSAPTKDFENRIWSKKLHHDGNPFLAWQVQNCDAYRDVNMNVKLRRSSSLNKIDSVIALVIANACASSNTAPEQQVRMWSIRDGKSDTINYIEPENQKAAHVITAA